MIVVLDLHKLLLEKTAHLINHPRQGKTMHNKNFSSMSEVSLINKVPLPYWRAALAEVSLLHPEVPAESKPIAISNDSGTWQVTAAEPDITQWITAQFNISKARSNSASAKTIPFMLVAARLSELAGHGVKQEAGDIHKGLTVLCIPCLLDRSGGLWPDPDRHPWIPRDLLEPTLKSVAIGSLGNYDKFISNLPNKACSFDDTLKIASELFQTVTGARLPLLPFDSDEVDMPPVFAPDGYELVSAWHGIPYDPPIIAKHLIKLYDQMINRNGIGFPLLDSLRTISSQPSQPPPAIQKAEQWYANTVGHISPEHPLSPSQREAMVELVRLNEACVLSINGPPGTGKTTLLQSVVAQLWIDAALKESECPLIVVASTNVKAVENVLDSFAKICAETNHKRWHPYDGGFGLFLASEFRESKHPTCTGKSHPYSEYETAEAVKSAEKYFLEQASALFEQKHDSVAKAVEALHKYLKYLEQKLKAIIAARYKIYRITGQNIADGAESSCQQSLAYHQEQIDTEHMVICAADKQLVTCKQAIEAAKSNYEAQWRTINCAEQNWNSYLASSPLWLDLLSFLPPIRRRRMARDRCFLMSNPLTANQLHRDDGVQQHLAALKQAAMECQSSALASIAKRSAVINNRKATSLKQRKTAEQAQSKVKMAFQNWENALKGSHANLLDVNVTLSDLNDQLDKALRAPMFRVSDWYWSGKWLLEMKKRLEARDTDSKGRNKLEAKYRRFAKLSPCLVSNFHMAPSFFTAWQGEDIPFWNTIDLLIVDEAGQVSPDVGAAMFALAKRALVVGDIYQIEPVWNNGEGTDRTNAVKSGLIPTPHDARYDVLEGAGYTPASGNLMRIANRCCSVQKYKDMGGLMLTEHRRCVPELIAYCNDLIYSGRLEPLRAPIKPSDRLLPPFAYLNVASQDKKVGGSRQNTDEAKAIVEWLKTNRAAIERHYSDEYGTTIPLWKLVGIVTPFASQAGVIERQLRKEMPDLASKNSRLTIGTVHALQGAERAIVIFSPTYGSSFKGGAFFDQKPNMLNVAVSRARDSFLVIGNLALFDVAKRSRPSGLLATYLFNEEWSSALEPMEWVAS